MVYEWLLLEMLASMLLQYYAFSQDDVSYDFLTPFPHTYISVHV